MSRRAVDLAYSLSKQPLTPPARYCAQPQSSPSRYQPQQSPASQYRHAGGQQYAASPNPNYHQRMFSTDNKKLIDNENWQSKVEDRISRESRESQRKVGSFLDNQYDKNISPAKSAYGTTSSLSTLQASERYTSPNKQKYNSSPSRARRQLNGPNLEPRLLRSPLADRLQDMSHLKVEREQEAFHASRKRIHGMYEQADTRIYEEPFADKSVQQKASFSGRLSPGRKRFQDEENRKPRGRSERDPEKGVLWTGRSDEPVDRTKSFVESMLENRAWSPVGSPCVASRLQESMGLPSSPEVEGTAARLKRLNNLLAHSQEMMIRTSNKQKKKRLKAECRQLDEFLQEEHNQYRDHSRTASAFRLRSPRSKVQI